MQDLISRKWLMECVDEGWIKFETEKDENLFIHLVRDIAPSAQPYTDEEIQKIQDLEQAQFDKIHDLAYQEGKANAMKWTSCNETVDIPDHEVLACNKYGEMIIGYLVYDDDQWICESETLFMYDPIAWLPLPEPYKEDDDGTR